ncbi:hypothetical protein [Pelagibius sp.]|uniref:hypothetical protein n=1 Tax=Pelagibius sp. TaxID=1931238 RepID=UPI003B50E9E7
MSDMQNDIANEFRALVEAAHRVSTDVGQTVEEILVAGTGDPLPTEEARSLLTRVVEVVRSGAADRGDKGGVAVLSRDLEGFINQVMATRTRLGLTPGRAPDCNKAPLLLQGYNGIQPRPVKPSPVFHEREIPVVEGFVRTRDIRVWDENERIDIHLNQFQQVHGRAPTSDELLDIMLGKLKLPGITDDDQFAIRELARSIAVNGVRKSPIIDIDGTLLDGNRRVSACYFILNSPDFSAEEKRRAEWLQVWQLTEHATDADRDSVIVSLNFEPDYKQDWPEYVKARKVYEHWQAMLALEPRANPSNTRQREMKREIARRFALSVDEVSKKIAMVSLAEEFEDYHVSERNQDKYAVKHRAERYFQYFDELGKGKGSGGVYWSLNQDDAFKHLVYDLLYEGKFQNWNKIRDLKYVYQNEDALACLRRAREEADVEAGQELVNDGCGLARASRAEQRQLGANTRVKVFVDWFKDLPVKTFQREEPGAITQDNLKGLHGVLQLVEQYLREAAEADSRRAAGE